MQPVTFFMVVVVVGYRESDIKLFKEKSNFQDFFMIILTYLFLKIGS